MAKATIRYLDEKIRRIEKPMKVNNLTTMISEHNTRLEVMMYEQNARLDGHNTRLEAILEKLANK